MLANLNPTIFPNMHRPIISLLSLSLFLLLSCLFSALLTYALTLISPGFLSLHNNGNHKNGGAGFSVQVIRLYSFKAKKKEADRKTVSRAPHWLTGTRAAISLKC